MRYGITMMLLCFMWTTANADWKLDKESSSLSYVSIKNNEIGEINYFTNLDANIQKDGIFTMEVDLNSVTTRYDLRDERMRKLFFETNKFAKASIKGRMPVKRVTMMSPGKVKRFKVRVMLDLHGHQQEIETELLIAKLAKNDFVAVTEQPILLNVQAFDMTEGLKKLTEIAKLDSISWVVPVTFSLVFK